jgi:transcriptional regulator with XRE-family HTH domain
MIMLEMGSVQPVGKLLAGWRKRRRLSQLELACEANISSRHLSFVETGRSQPSREMVLHLAEQLEVPLRERNVLLTAAGFAPVFQERPLDAPALGAARRVVELVLAGHEPNPALAIDRHWTLVAANRAVAPLLGNLDSPLLAPPVNVLRLSLHPEGLAARIVNLAGWRAHVLERLRRQVELTADPVLAALMKEIGDYPAPEGAADDAAAPAREAAADEYAGVVVPFLLATDRGILSCLTTTTIFGTPVDITLSELAIESFFPADAATAEYLQKAFEH